MTQKYVVRLIGYKTWYIGNIHLTIDDPMIRIDNATKYFLTRFQYNSDGTISPMPVNEAPAADTAQAEQSQYVGTIYVPTNQAIIELIQEEEKEKPTPEPIYDLCFMCQKEIYANDFGSIDGISITDTAGYGSRFDGEVFTLTCCDDCLEKGFINKREES